MTENKVLATVEGKEITEQDVNAFLRALVREIGQQKALQYTSPEGKKRLLDELINQELFALNALADNLETEEEFKQQLAEVKKNLLRQYAVQKLLRDVKVRDEEAERYYEQHPEQFVSPESVKASHILMDSQEEIEKALAEINAGLPFAEAAEKYSKCPTSAKGGDLGYFTRGKMVPEFEKAAFEAQIGEISEPVKSQFGYHIIQVLDKKQGELRPFAEVKQELAVRLLDQKRHQVYQDKCAELRQNYDLKIKD